MEDFNPEKHLEENYGMADSMISYMNINKLYDYYKGEITRGRISEIVSKTESYSLLKPMKKSKQYNYTIVHYKRDLIQSNLFYVTKLQEFNDNVKYVLTIIDCYTKRLWCEPLITKTCSEVSKAIGKILERMGKLPRVFVR